MATQKRKIPEQICYPNKRQRVTITSSLPVEILEIVMSFDPPQLVPRFRQLNKYYRDTMATFSSQRLLTLCMRYMDSFTVPTVQCESAWKVIANERLLRWHQILMFAALDNGVTPKDFRSVYAMSVPYGRHNQYSPNDEITWTQEIPAYTCNFASTLHGIALAKLRHPKSNMSFDATILEDKVPTRTQIGNISWQAGAYAIELIIQRILACDVETMGQQLRHCLALYSYWYSPAPGTDPGGWTFNTLAQTLRHSNSAILLGRLIEANEQGALLPLAQLYNLAKRMDNTEMCTCIELLVNDRREAHTHTPTIGGIAFMDWEALGPKFGKSKRSTQGSYTRYPTHTRCTFYRRSMMVVGSHWMTPMDVVVLMSMQEGFVFVVHVPLEDTTTRSATLGMTMI